jgi:AAA+ ATPase superfamily predicted ATPase
MKENIIGRKKEIKRLQQYIDSSRSEFIAIYGRRRVGKTYLVKELFGDRLAFRMTGMENINTSGQLTNFSMSLQNFTTTDTHSATWGDAFRLLV